MGKKIGSTLGYIGCFIALIGGLMWSMLAPTPQPNDLDLIGWIYPTMLSIAGFIASYLVTLRKAPTWIGSIILLLLPVGYVFSFLHGLKFNINLTFMLVGAGITLIAGIVSLKKA